MYCHKCGAANQSAKAYCKACGEWLPNLPAKTRHTFGGETPQQIILTNLFMSALSTVVALFSGLALYITYLGTDDAKWSVYIAGAFCLCIAGWQASTFFITLRLRQRLKHSRESGLTTSELTEPQKAPALNAGDMSSFVGATSVTENSTDLLEHVRSPKRDTQRTVR